MTPERESISALATVTLDARALDQLGPATLDRLAELVEARLTQRRAAGEEVLLTPAAAAEIAGVHADTVRRAIRSGELEAAGYVGTRARIRRAEVDAWVARGRGPAHVASPARTARPGFRPRARQRVLGQALDELREAA